jgi:hypothetical protein
VRRCGGARVSRRIQAMKATVALDTANRFGEHFATG